MGQAAIPLIMASSAVTAYGSYRAGTDERNMAQYDAKVAAVEGDAAQQEAISQEQIKRGQNRAVMARQRVLMGSSGITGGTFDDVAAQSAQAGELDAMAIRMGGAMKKRQAVAQAGLYRAQGSSAYSAGLLGAATALTGGGARASTLPA